MKHKNYNKDVFPNNQKKINYNIFEKSVQATPDVKNHYKTGLRALGSNSKHVSISKQNSLNGSLDIDEATKTLYPNECRWDYSIGYNDKAYFLEVHPMNTSNANEVIKKKLWLDNWLILKAPLIKDIIADGAFYWAASGKNALLKNSKESRQIAKCHIKTVKKLIL